MIAYIYDIDSRHVLVAIKGDDNATIEAYSKKYEDDKLGMTYSPAFGANDGLVMGMAPIITLPSKD